MFGLPKKSVKKELSWEERYHLRSKERKRKTKKTLWNAFISMGILGTIIAILLTFRASELNIPLKKVSQEGLLKKTEPYSIATEIHKMIIDGEYNKAINLLKEKIKKNPNDINLKNIYSQLMDDLKIDFKFHYLPKRRSIAIADLASSNLTLTSQDPYYLTVHASARCYLYIFQLNSSKDLIQLFPSEDVPTVNPIPPGGPLRIPDGVKWLHLDEIPGNEIIYLIASHWRNEVIEELSKQIHKETDSQNKRQLIEKLISRIKLEDEATDNIPGLVFGVIQFTHAPSSNLEERRKK